MVSPFIIGVAGGSASGKKDVCTFIMQELAKSHPTLNRRMAIVSITDFYRDLSAEEKAQAEAGEFNFDHPDAFDFKLLEKFLTQVASGSPAEMPQYDFNAKKRTGFVAFPPTDVILFEGILVLYKRKIRDFLSMRIFVDVDSDVRLSATVTRDTLGQRNRQIKPLELVLNQWLTFVKPAFEDFILPTKRSADVVIPRGFENKVALDLLVRHIDEILTSLTNVNSLSPGLPPSKRASMLSVSANMAALRLEASSPTKPKAAAHDGVDNDSDPSAPSSPTKGQHPGEGRSMLEEGESRFSETPN
ncbi:uridine kinase family-domain-containing protein [Catenaria anguillulae PL171]|uniref:uridine/cytidine kinase n=1 Tax=Catenaria anguillulae PL171 TaxID=765915 RepID=A0A1Y2HZT0_9FUNG|nr:uridine kinase family-domain-containing protein [Catenaria anguillulae PL171]